MSPSDSSRRDFLKKTAYVAPFVLTMNVSLAQAQVGSARQLPIENGTTYIQSSSDDGSRQELRVSGSRHEHREFRGRGHAYGRLGRDD